MNNSLSPAAPVGCRADVFSAGLCLAELLTGVRRVLDVEFLAKSYDELRDGLAAASAAREAALTFQPLLERLERTEAGERRRSRWRRGGGVAAARARLTPEAADLCVRLLAWNPESRLDAADALLHPYFRVSEQQAAAEDACWKAAVHAESEARCRKRRATSRELRRLAS